MKKELRILILDDDADDVLLINHELHKAHVRFRTHWVKTKGQFLDALQHMLPDLIVSDHDLPSFDGFAALTAARNRFPDVPFIFVIDAIRDRQPVQLFKRGATDFVVKRRFSSLIPAVQRVLREAKIQVRHKHSQAVWAHLRQMFSNFFGRFIPHSR